MAAEFEGLGTLEAPQLVAQKGSGGAAGGRRSRGNRANVQRRRNRQHSQRRHRRLWRERWHRGYSWNDRYRLLLRPRIAHEESQREHADNQPHGTYEF